MFIAIINQKLFMWQMPMGSAQNHHFSVDVMIVTDNERIMESNNLFSNDCKVRLWSTKLKLIKLPPYSLKLKFCLSHVLKKVFG